MEAAASTVGLAMMKRSSALSSCIFRASAAPGRIESGASKSVRRSRISFRFAISLAVRSRTGDHVGGFGTSGLVFTGEATDDNADMVVPRGPGLEVRE